MNFFRRVLQRARGEATSANAPPVAQRTTRQSEGDELYHNGKSKLAARDWKGAAEIFWRVVALQRTGDTHGADAQILRAAALFELSARADAEASLEAGLAGILSDGDAIREAVRLLHGLKRHGDALALEERCTPLPPQPGSAADWLGLGNAALREGDFERASDCYRRVSVLDPGNPVAWLNRGFARLELGDAVAALGMIDRVFAVVPPGEAELVADAHFCAGLAHARLGNTASALASIEAAVESRPGFEEAIALAIPLLREAKRFEDALAWARRLEQLRPDQPAAVLETARSLHELSMFDEALGAVERALGLAPRQPEGWIGKGHILLSGGAHAHALEAFERAVALAGHHAPSALADLAVAHAALGQSDELLELCERILQAPEPGRTEAVHRLLYYLQGYGMPEHAARVAKEVLRQSPGDAEVHWVLAFACLTLGDFERGWQEYEWRWQAPTGTKSLLPDFARPRWLGQEDLRDKRLLIAPEQGFGDCIQFLRYVPDAARLARSVVVCLHPDLCALVARAGLPENCSVAPFGSTVEAFDYQTPLLSLPLALGPAAPIPAVVPYLRADAGLVDAWRRRLDALGPGLKVGVTWCGNPLQINDRNRSMPLHVFRQIELEGCHFISLQPNVRSRDQDALRAWTALRPWAEEFRSFDDTAALVTALDVVVAVDTSVAHLAGALGRPLHVVLTYAADFRWLKARPDSPWYPTARLHRQSRIGDWSEPLASVRAELQRLAAQT